MSSVRPVVSTVQPGIAFARVLITMPLARKAGMLPAEFASKAAWRDTPHVKGVFEYRMKADVSGGSSISGDDWAGALAEFGLSGDALGVLRGLSIFEQVKSKMPRRPFKVSVPRQTGAGTAGAWVSEGAAVPAVKFAFDGLSLDVKKLQTMWIVTDDLLRRGGAAGEATVRDVSLGGVAANLDNSFLNPAATGGDANPAGITASATAVTSTGSSASQITTDLNAMVAAITTSGRALVWIMRPTTAATIALTLGAAASDLPRTLAGLPVVLSGNSPAQITLADLGEIVYADDGGFDVAMSSQAAIEMETAPEGISITAGSPAGPVGTELVSLFQANAHAFLLTRTVNWEVVRSGAVAYMTVSY